MKTIPLCRALALVLTVTATALHAQVPQMINYQGRVAVGTPAVNFDGSGTFKFALVNTDGTASHWSNDGSSTAGSEPTAAVTLTVSKGLYSVLLGDVSITNMTAIPNAVFANADVRLRVWFNDGTNGSQLLTPDQRLAAVGYIATGAVGSAQIADGAVGSTQIASGAVGSTQIASGAVGSTQIATNAITSTQIAAGTITADKLAKQVRSGSILNNTITPDGNGGGTFAVTFSPSFATVPIVTLSLEASATSPAANSSVFLTGSRTTGGFSGAITGDGVTAPPVTIDQGTCNVGEHTSMAIVGGWPAICYYDVDNGDLKFMRAKDVNGAGWAPPVTIDSTGTVGQFASLKLVNNNPAICYYDSTNGDLKFVRATNVNGTAWGAAVTIDSPGDVGQFTSMAIVGGNPAISYYDVSNGLKYVQAIDASGTSWNPPVNVVAGATQYTSLAVVNSNPAISYYGENFNDLKYVRATDASGTAWGAPVIVHGDGVGGGALNVGQYTSLVVVNSNPAISYYDATNSALKFVRATNVNGAAWDPPVTLDSAGDVGQFTSMAVVNGWPAISYYDSTNGNLKYVRATDASGTAWGSPAPIDSTDSVGQYTSLVVVNNNPAICYYDLTNGDLKFVRATELDGTTWGTPGTAHGIESVGSYPSHAVVNGNPAISYYDFANGDLKFVRATNASGRNWGTPVTIDHGNVGRDTSLAVVNSNPAISYYDFANGDLKYVRATDTSGTTWGTPVTVDTGGTYNVGQYTSLTVVNNNPAICYYDSTNGDLKYVRAMNLNGGAWGTPVTVDTGGTYNVGQYTSLVVVNNNPAISYYDATNSALKYVRANTTSGTLVTDWGTPVTIDSPGIVGQYTSLVVVNNNPAISYYDATNSALKYVLATTTSGTLVTDWGTPVTIDSADTVGQSTSLTVVNGNPAISYYDQTNSALKYVRANNVTGAVLADWAAPVTIDTGGVGSFTSLTVINGIPAISYNDFANDDLKYVRALDASGATWNLAPFTIQWIALEP